MRALIFILVFVLLLGHTEAKSVVIHVTPSLLETGHFSFKVKSEPKANGHALFVIQITAKEGQIPKSASFSLASVEEKKDAKGTISSQSILGENIESALNVVREGNTVTCTFVIPPNSEISFVFDIPDKGGMAADFYCIKLKDFMSH